MPNTPISNMKAADPGLAFNVNLDSDELNSISPLDQIKIDVSVQVGNEASHDCKIIIDRAEDSSTEDETLVVALPFRCANYSNASDVSVTVKISKRTRRVIWKEVYTHSIPNLAPHTDQVMAVSLIDKTPKFPLG